MGSFGYVVYEVVDGNPFEAEEVSIPIMATWPDGSSVGDIRASVTLAPVSTVATASLEESEPRFVDNAGDPTTIFPCSPAAATGGRDALVAAAARPGRTSASS
ncbi:MAG: hypothetical protein R2724_31620 [Bryobacterales bacterium]